MTTQIETYKAILSELDRNPDASVIALCKKHKIHYQSFQSWRRRHQPETSNGKARKQVGPVKPGVGASQTLVAVDLEALAQAYIKGERKVTFDINEIIEKLSEEEKKTFAANMGYIMFAQRQRNIKT